MKLLLFLLFSFNALFVGGTYEDYYGNLCTNNFSVHSMWAAAKLYCTSSEIAAGEKLIGGYCTDYGLLTLVPYSRVLPDLTDEYISSLQVVNYDDIDIAKVWNHSVLLSRSLADAGERTTVTFDYEYKLHQSLGWSVYAFWSIVLLVGISNRALNNVSKSRRLKSATDVESSEHTINTRPKGSSIFSGAKHWLHTHMIIPTAFGTHHKRLLWWCNVPTRLEIVVITIFWILNFVICCVDYQIFDPNLYYTRSQQKWRYIADRTGIVCYANLPWLWMFSGRNNIFIWFTGWDFATFNIFHRNIARVATIQAIVHSIGYTGLELSFHDLAASWKQKYWYMGGLATIVMSVLLGFSSIFIRKSYYEVFLLIHIVASVLVIVGLWYHTEIFEGEWDPYLWPLVGIWVFDRTLRIVRIIRCNVHINSMSQVSLTKTVATYDKEARLITLEITPGSSMLRPAPGQHYFIYQPFSWKGWENHPFTLANWHGNLDSGDHAFESPERSFGKEVEVAPGTSSHDSSSAASSQQGSDNSGEQRTSRNTLRFYMRPFDSWTKRLANQCLQSPSSSSTTQILIEGPYGEQYSLHTFEKIVFIVGGSGITGALPYLHNHAKATSQTISSDSKRPVTRTRHVTLIWTAKQSAMITTIFDRELRSLVQRDDIDMRFHATSKEEYPDTIDKTIDKAPVVNSELDIVYGRPNVGGELLRIIEDIDDAGITGERVAVFSCGPAEMADEVRSTVHQALKSGRREVEYFEESFGW